MEKYQKINSIFKRDKHKNFIIGDYSLPEFEYLKDNIWDWYEKIDGMNIRISPEENNVDILPREAEDEIEISKMSDELLYLLKERFHLKLFRSLFPTKKVVIYGEGYGRGIHGGGKYIPDGVDFIIFDITIDGWYLNIYNMLDVANKFNTKVVPLIGQGTLNEAIEKIQNKVYSQIGDCLAEGLVLRPTTELWSRKGERIITKIKHKDFKING